MNRFEDFADKRQKTAGKKYRMDNGDNMGLYRNGLQDIMEELADAYNIMKVFAEKYVRKNGWNPTFAQAVVNFCNKLDAMANDLDWLHHMEGVDKVAKDDIRVDRPVYFQFTNADGLFGCCHEVEDEY